MTQQTRIRQQETIPYAANDRQVIELGRGMIYRELALTLAGQITLAAAGNTAAATLRGDEWAVVRRVELILNGSDVVRSLTGDELYWLNRQYYGSCPRLEPTIGDAITVNPAFESTYLLPFWSPRTIKPFDTVLDSSKVSKIELAVTWGSELTINAAATGWTVAPTMRVHSSESYGVTGDFSLSHINRITQSPAGANPDYIVRLPTGGYVYRGFLINAQTAAAPPVDSGAIINRIRLQSGPTVFFDAEEASLRQWNNLRNGLDDGLNHEDAAAAMAYSILRRNTKASPLGWYFVDLCGDGYQSEAIDTAGISELNLSLDIAAAGNIVVLPLALIPPRK